MFGFSTCRLADALVLNSFAGALRLDLYVLTLKYTFGLRMCRRSASGDIFSVSWANLIFLRGRLASFEGGPSIQESLTYGLAGGSWSAEEAIAPRHWAPAGLLGVGVE